MLIDKTTLLSLLSGDDKYKGQDIVANTLPSDAVLEITIESTVTAEYYDEVKEELISFNLDFSHFDRTMNYQNHVGFIEKETNKSLMKERKGVAIKLSDAKKMVTFNISCKVGLVLLVASVVVLINNYGGVVRWVLDFVK